MKLDTRNNFDGLRLLGALMVLFHHQFALLGHREPALFGVTFGAAGVVLFFAVSGYLVSESWHRDPHLLRFAARRLLRVWPGLALVVVSLWAIVRLIEFSDPMDKLVYPIAADQFLVSNLMFDHWEASFFPGNPHKVLNQPLWTIAYEVQCYLLLAAAGALLALPVHRALSAAAVLAVAGFVAFSGTTGDLPSLGAYFLAGVAMRALPRHGVAVVLLGACAGLLLVDDHRFGLHMLIPALVIPVGRRSWPVLRNGARFGDLSYGVYLWGWPVQQLGVLWFGTGAPVWALLPVSLAASGTLAYVSWHLVEKRALRLKPV
jgi:peptidoglycan/LPS O-acetylase OafA/YrhL